MGTKVDCLSTMLAKALSCWKMKNLIEIGGMAGRNCCNGIILWQQASLTLTPWLTSIKLMYCHPLAWLADLCHQWLNVNRVRSHFVAMSFFLVPAGAHSQSIYVLCGNFISQPARDAYWATRAYANMQCEICRVDAHCLRLAGQASTIRGWN